MHPFCRLESRPSGSSGWTPGRLDAEAPFRRSSAGRRTLDCPFPRMTPNSLEHHPDPSDAATGRAWGRAAGGNDRASGLGVAGAEEAGGIGYFWPWLAYPPAARVRRASQSPVRPPSAIPGGGGERRGLVDPGGGAMSGPTFGLLPPQSIRVSTALGSDPRPPALLPRTCVPQRPARLPPRCPLPAAHPVGHGLGPGLLDPAR